MRYPRSAIHPRRNPVLEEGDPLAIIDSYLDSGIYPGAAAIDDLQVICEMYVEHYWREIEDFKPPGDLQDWVADQVPGWGGPSLHAIPEVIESWQNLTAEDAIEYYTERVRYHCDRAKHRAKQGDWWNDLTYLLGMLVLGDDRVANVVVDVSDFVLEHWMPSHEVDPPPWECITRTARRLGILSRVERCEARRQGKFSTLDMGAWPDQIAWRGDVGVFNEAGYRLFSFWYLDEFTDTPIEQNLLQQANRHSFEELLADIPYFDCQWCARVRDEILTGRRRRPDGGVDPGVSIDRVDFFLQLRRPSGWPTLLAYFYDWFWDIATMDEGEDRDPVPIAFDPELYGELEESIQNLLEQEDDELADQWEIDLPNGLYPGPIATERDVSVRLPAALDILRVLSPAHYDQLGVAPFGAIPAHAQEDPEAAWWNEQGVRLLQDVIDIINDDLEEYGVELREDYDNPDVLGIYEMEDVEEDEAEDAGEWAEQYVPPEDPWPDDLR